MPHVSYAHDVEIGCKTDNRLVNHRKFIAPSVFKHFPDVGYVNIRCHSEQPCRSPPSPRLDKLVRLYSPFAENRKMANLLTILDGPFCQLITAAICK